VNDLPYGTSKIVSKQPQDTLDIILDRLFDYAGMFPPAAKSFEAALRESASLPQTLRRPFMLNADIVLDTLATRALCNLNLRSFGFTREISVALLATSEVSEVLEVAENLMTARRTEDDVRCRVSSIELKLPAKNPEGVVESLVNYCRPRRILLAIEPDLSTPEWNNTLEATVQELQTLSPAPALKSRGSGPTGIGPERLARAVCRACDAHIPLKVTGGFHHPIVEKELYGNTMGFLNLTVAVMLRRSRVEAITEDEIATLLVNPFPSAFAWGERVRYGRHSISRQELIVAKNSGPFSIGSCSLFEPDEDLARVFANSTG
jgi:hypothetical protein